MTTACIARVSATLHRLGSSGATVLGAIPLLPVLYSVFYRIKVA